MLKQCVYKTIVVLSVLFSAELKAQLVINEVAPCNVQTGFDEDGDASDWVEIYNSGSGTINLGIYYLSDNSALLTKWQFPAVNLNPGSFYIVYLSGKNKITVNTHANFSVKKNEFLILSNGASITDSIKIQGIPFNTSFNKSASEYRYYLNPTPLAANNSYSTWIISNPVITPSSGFYSSAVTVQINHWLSSAEIHYTLDGSEPTLSSPLYTGPFTVDKSSSSNQLSAIPTNPSFTYPVGSYDSIRANNRGWLPPYDTVNKNVIVKAKAFYGGAISAPASSSVYFIEPMLNNRYNAPVITLVTDTINLFNADKGIYIYGNAVDGNYNEEGDAWEIPVKMHLFDEAGNEIVNEWCGAHLHGGGGRHSAIKSLKLFFRDNYGKDELEHYFFEKYIQNKHNNFLLRSPGHRPDCISKDELAIDLTGGLRIDKPQYKPVVLFLNNEYWGIHSFREAMDEEYLSHKYHLKEDEITILDAEGQLENGAANDTLLYMNLENFISTSDMTLTSNFNVVKEQMDIDNYIDYYCSEIFLGNGDWPNNNIKFWRKNSVGVPSSTLPYGQDGRWRWIMYDLDGGFGGTCSGTFPTFNTMAQSVATGPLFSSYTKLFRGLLTNNNFKIQFINRMCDLLNSTYHYNHTSIVTDSTLTQYDNLMQEHVERWRYPSVATDLVTRSSEIPSLTRWNTIKNELQFYLTKRPSYQRKHMFNYFSLIDSSTITINVNDTLAGNVRINTLLINSKLHGINGPTYPWNGIYFDSLPLTLEALPLPGFKFLYWQETGNTNAKQTVQLFGDSIFTAVFGIDSSFSPSSFIDINEISSSNASWIKDEFNEYDDWLELYNATNDTVDLSGYYLSDDRTFLTKFTIASSAQSKIAPHGFHLYWCDNQIIQGEKHCNFSLSSFGETVYLTHPDGNTILDSLKFGTLPSDYSFGDIPNGSDEMTSFNYPTPNQSNELTQLPETGLKMNLMVYPNPSNGRCVVYNGEKEKMDLSLVSLNGLLLRQYTVQPGNNEIHLNDLENGIYVFRFTLNGNSTYNRIILCK